MLIEIKPLSDWKYIPYFVWEHEIPAYHPIVAMQEVQMSIADNIDMLFQLIMDLCADEENMERISGFSAYSEWEGVDLSE